MILTYIEFYDHYTDGDEWTELEHLADASDLEPMVCRSVGWLVAENRQMVKLIANIDGSPMTAARGFGSFNILKRDILRRVSLPLPKRKARR